MKTKKDLIGITFTYLTVIDGPIKKNNRKYWKCQCKCGKIKEVREDGLKSGRTKSCGCYKNEIFVQNNKKRQTINLTNKRFGKLIAIEPTEKRTSDGRVIWKCKCDCGNIKEVSSHTLTQGEIISCGCITSLGELIIENLLIQNKIPFEKQKTFNDCRFPDTNYLARFDFYVKNKYLIEYDGEQHFYFDTRKNSWNTKLNYEKTKKHDEFKNQWCKENNIPLIRIPYTHKNKICLEDLLLESSIYKI